MKRFRFFMCFCFLFNVLLVANTEEPIKVFYWKSSDIKSPRQNELDSYLDMMVEVQAFFASEMERHGFGAKTFDFTPEIRVIKGKRKLADYTEDKILVDESPLIKRGLDNQIYVLFFGGVETFMGSVGMSRGQCHTSPDLWIYCNNLVVVPTGLIELLLPVLAHEIAHAFGINGHSSNRMISGKFDVMYFSLEIKRGVVEELSRYAFLDKHARLLNEGGRLTVQERLPIVYDGEGMDADVNNDGYVDLSDVRIVRSAIKNTNSYDTDVNNDGRTDEVDVLIVKAKAHEAISAAAPSLQRKRTLTGTWGALKGGRRLEH